MRKREMKHAVKAKRKQINAFFKFKKVFKKVI